MFKIVLGNIPFSYSYSAGFSHDKLWDIGKPDIILDSNIAQFEHKKTIQAVSASRSAFGLILFGLSFGYLFGVLGAACGGFLGAMLCGRSTRQMFSVILTDNRYFVAVSDTSTYQKLLARSRLSAAKQLNQRAAL